MRTEDDRAGRLLDAQANAVALFDEVVARGIITAGRGEQEVSDQIRDLANEMFGKTRHWHKRIVRSGPHTLQPYQENPPDRVIEADDIAFADFGPIFDEFEADLGRTYVLGGDPVKHRLAADLPVIFSAGRRYFASHPDITGAQLYAEIARLARLVGEFPHETIDGARIESYIAPGNTTPMRRRDKAGRVCHWILEIHLTDPARGFGGFYEQLLDLG
jgi:Metallopeptidase family M24